MQPTHLRLKQRSIIFSLHQVCCRSFSLEKSHRFVFIISWAFPYVVNIYLTSNICRQLQNTINQTDYWNAILIDWLIDIFFSLACSLGYCMSKYPGFQFINSEVNEQENAKIKKLKTQLSYMTPENFLGHCKLFFWFRNKKNKARRAKKND